MNGAIFDPIPRGEMNATPNFPFTQIKSCAWMVAQKGYATSCQSYEIEKGRREPPKAKPFFDSSARLDTWEWNIHLSAKIKLKKSKQNDLCY